MRRINYMKILFNILLLFSVIYCTNSTSNIWEKININLPPSSVQNFGAHKSCLINQKIYIFGGAQENRTLGIDFGDNPFIKYYGNLLSYDIKKDKWTILVNENSTVSKPYPRAFFGMDCSEKLGKLWIFGGLFPGPQFPLPSEDFWEYNIATNEFTEIPKSDIIGEWPPERSANILKYFENYNKKYLIVYGGASLFFSQLNDTWIYSFQTNKWCQIIPTIKMGGNINTLSTVYKNKLYIYSGEREAFPGSGLQGTWRWAPEVFAFNFKQRTWSLIFNNSNENQIINRAYSGAASVNNYFLIFSGDYGIWRNTQTIFNSTCSLIANGVDYLVPEVVYFDLDEEKWHPNYLPEYQTPVSPFKISKADPLNIEPIDGRLTVNDPNSNAPPALKRTDMVCNKRHCFISGGWGGIGSGLPTTNQFYNNYIWKLKPLKYLP